MTDHKAEAKNHVPKHTKTAKLNKKIAWCPLAVQNCLDLKIAKATTLYHKKSQSQWTTANTENSISPKFLAVIMRVVPIVIHHKMKPALAAVVQTPAIRASCRELWYFS